jgi:glycosyltransferase involved in cell wall biosynthesis
VYDGYRIRPFQRELNDGIEITRLALYPSHDRSKIGRIFNYVSFFLSATIYLVFVARRADVIYAYHPPLTVGLAAALARLVRRVPVVLDVQDIWPDTLRATGMIGNERILSLIDKFCRWTWRHVDRLAVLSHGFRRLLLERGVKERNVRVIHNWAEEQAVSGPTGPTPDIFSDTSRFRVLFAGNIGAAQALDSVLQAAKFVSERTNQIDFCFLGSGIELDRLKGLAGEMGLINVQFLPRVPASEVGAWLHAADCLLVHLRRDPLFEITIPSKTQAYMAAGKPVIMGVEGDAAELIRQSGGGMVVPPEQPQALADAVIALSLLTKRELAEIGHKSRQFYSDNLSLRHGIERFIALFDEVIAERKARRT